MDFLTSFLSDFAEWALGMLPDSPFLFLQDFENSDFQVYINYLNWFIDFQKINAILVAWCGAILIYYLYQIVLRWAKAIE